MHIECTHNCKKYKLRSTAAEATECPLADQSRKQSTSLVLISSTGQYLMEKKSIGLPRGILTEKKASNQASQLKLIINY